MGFWEINLFWSGARTNRCGSEIVDDVARRSPQAAGKAEAAVFGRWSSLYGALPQLEAGCRFG